MSSVDTAPQSYARAATIRHGFAALALMSDVLAILVNAAVSGGLYHLLIYRDANIANLVGVGFLTALIFAGANVIRNEYTVQNYLSVRNHAETVVKLWALTFPFLLTVGFMTKTSESFSRGAVAVFFVVGVPIIIGARWLLVGAVNRGIARGLIAAQRLFIAGTRSAITDLLTEYQPLRNGIHVVGTMELAASDHPSPDAAEELRGAVAQAVERVRHLRPDAIVIAAPWWQLPGGTEPLRDFMNVPVDIYVTSQGLLDWASGSHISRLGPIPLFCIARHPFSQAEIIEKRIFDVVIGTIALVCCAPLMALAAVLIRLDSKGPVLFLQRRYGFNQRAYRIIKFRTMTCLDDGDHVPQATVADVRITRVGRWLRRWNIDELPQLFNVLKGDMSLVGPRPHALQHNYEHESKIALYARRHNVKPGITGWAQVNGWRGETDREDKMRRRVEHDLYYIEHWSLWFDLYILFLTVFSRRSYSNAR